MYRKRRRTRFHSRSRFSRAIKHGQFQFLKHKLQGADLVLTAGTTGQSIVNFNLTLVPNFADYTAIYEQYRIVGIKFELLPRENVNTATSTQALDHADIVTVIDSTEVSLPGATPPTYSSLINYGNVKRTMSNRRHVRYFRPAVLVPSYISGTIGGTTTPMTFGVMPRYRQWIDTGEPNVPHLGLIVGYNATTTQVAINMSTWVTYYVQFKERKV